MRKNEIDELINIYETQGMIELVEKLYYIQKQYKDAELNSLISAYMHLTNQDRHSFFYTSKKEQIVTNNTRSLIYFNKQLFDFKNINDKKIVTKESFRVNKKEISIVLGAVKDQFKKGSTNTCKVECVGNNVIVSTNEKQVEFPKQEFELICKLLNSSTYNLSNDSSYLNIEGENGYAYILGKRI